MVVQIDIQGNEYNMRHPYINVDVVFLDSNTNIKTAIS